MDLQLNKMFDTTELIEEIRRLVKEVDDCILPQLCDNDLVEDLQMSKKAKLYDKHGLFSEDDHDKDIGLDKLELMVKCCNNICHWKTNAAASKLGEDPFISSKQRRKRIKRNVESDIRKQREKFHSQQEQREQQQAGGSSSGVGGDKKQSVQKKMRRLWRTMVKKEMGKCARQRLSVRRDKLAVVRRAARECSRICRQKAVASNKCAKDALVRGRKLAREISMCWRQLDKEEKTTKKKADRLLTEQKRKNLEMLEAKRQQRKLNYLITQTELYTHFMARKMQNAADSNINSIEDNATWSILERLDEVKDSDTPDLDDSKSRIKIDKKRTLETVKKAVEKQTKQIQSFPAVDVVSETPQMQQQPDESSGIFQGQLKSYQERGRQWLLHLFEQGINGILADEMGLGKTVQTLALLASLAHKYELWGPFLIVAPASTVHNWAQELARFVPAFRVVPYWGSVAERRILRRFWTSSDPSTAAASGNRVDSNGGRDDSAGILRRDSAFHVVVSSYQVVLQDARMVGRVRWQYLVLDEAHAIKNTASQRWATLLGFDCRNRLLLTGTPIQNTMQELWALLHFIMPTLFDSHEEFNEWFSRDIESQAAVAAAANASNIGGSTKPAGVSGLTTTTRLTATQLSRLHLILQPFMLRRIKAEVEHELPQKVERLLECQLSSRQRQLYERLKRRIRIDDLHSAACESVSQQHQQVQVQQQKSLLNLVMQLRKVCNHPDLVEPRLERFSVTSRFVDRWLLCPRAVWQGMLAPTMGDWAAGGRLLKDRHPVYDELGWLASGVTLRLLPCAGKREQLQRPVWWHEPPCPVVVASPVLLAVHTAAGGAWCSSAGDLVDDLAGSWRPGLSHTVQLVSPDSRLADSSKLATLDRLLLNLRRDNHRVLIYCQMTRMIDLIEQLLRRRRLSFIRLDGSSRLCDRRDMVARFQQTPNSSTTNTGTSVTGSCNSEAIFAFLLSTRAGGLGINLTAADTVIFYDSDWNPTVDEQAMDRAHRLGQQRQVTVYRLVCANTVEQHMLYRAEEKRQMQRMVIAGATDLHNAEDDLAASLLLPHQPHTAAATASGSMEHSSWRSTSKEAVASLLLEDAEVRARLEQARMRPGKKEMDPVASGGGTADEAEAALQRKRRAAWRGLKESLVMQSRVPVRSKKAKTTQQGSSKAPSEAHDP